MLTPSSSQIQARFFEYLASLQSAPPAQVFHVFPAIDLREGRCVRLRQGDPAAETIFGADPAAVARRWANQGAAWLHVVNLDGALQIGSPYGLNMPTDKSLPVNLHRLAQIRQTVSTPIQFGGGLRTLADIELALTLGATRVILGTVALRDPDMLHAALRRFGAGRILVSIDARDGLVATHGWRRPSRVQALDMAKAIADAGVQTAVYTDIGRDGMLSGVDVEGAVALAEASGLDIIVSGGLRDLNDIRNLLAVQDQGVIGAIAGQALYSGQIQLPDALALVVAAGSA